MMEENIQGILPVDKPAGITSFKLVSWSRKAAQIKKIGHAGTLDPFATGVVILLIGRNYTRLSDRLMSDNKEYEALLHLGVETDSYDCDGETLAQSNYQPALEQIQTSLESFQGWQEQVPPMFSAKKIDGQKLYHLARKGITIERQPAKVFMQISLLDYAYPYLKVNIACSKGTYIRSFAHDFGRTLSCGAHLASLRRTKSGKFSVENCLDGTLLQDGKIPLEELRQHMITSDMFSS